MTHRRIRRALLLAPLFGACGPGAAEGSESTEAESSTTESSGSSSTETSGDGDGDGDGDPSTGDGDGDPSTGDGDGDGDPAPSCGDGQLDRGEACDDGNTEAGDGCSPSCELSGGALLATYSPGPSWPTELLLLTHASSLPPYFLFIAGRTNVGDYQDEVRVVGLTTDGVELFSSVAPLPLAGRLPVNLETIDVDGACWISGWGYDEDIQVDVPGWMWVGRVDGAGDWVWAEETGAGTMPLATVMRGNENAAILEYTVSLGGPSSSFLTFDSLGGLEQAMPIPLGSDPNHGISGLASAPGGTYVAAGWEWTVEEVAPDEFEVVAEDLWIGHLDGEGALVDEFVFAPPEGLWARPESIMRDGETGTYAVLVSEREGQGGDEHIGWVRLDQNAESVLGWRSVGPGTPVAIEPDGQGGAYVLGKTDGSFVLGRYGPDPDAPPLWLVTQPRSPVDLAVNVFSGRAYVLTEVGVDVFML